MYSFSKYMHLLGRKIYLRNFMTNLTRWGLNKMASSSQTTFQNVYFKFENIWISIQISLIVVPTSKGPIVYLFMKRMPTSSANKACLS